MRSETWPGLVNCVRGHGLIKDCGIFGILSLGSCREIYQDYVEAQITILERRELSPPLGPQFDANRIVALVTQKYPLEIRRCLSLIAGLQAGLGILAVRLTLPDRPMNLSATQRLRLKHTLEPECWFCVGFLGLLFFSRLLLFRFHRVPFRH